MKKAAVVVAILAAVSTIAGVIGRHDGHSPGAGLPSEAAAASRDVTPRIRVDDGLPWSHIDARRRSDVAAIETFRPGYTFWRNIFTITDGSIVFGSAADGRRLAVFPAAGDWTRRAKWDDRALAGILKDQVLPTSLDDRREHVAQLLDDAAGPVLHNETRGGFLTPGALRYGRFLAEWGSIYERFGVPAEIGLAQALLESGFVGTRRSEANAVGLCQWLKRNWDRLDQIAPAVLEVQNQTTQAAYCAAYLTVLATKYGSFIPALSEHHAGGTNVGRILVSGERLGGQDSRERYFLGAELSRDLRTIAEGDYSDLYASYGPRSYRYAEMVFGNTSTVEHLIDVTRQTAIFAMRTAKSLSVAQISQRTRLSEDEIRRFNPALVKRVPAGATLYLPVFDAFFGRDVSFWHRPATAAYTKVLNEFVRLEASPEEWDARSFAKTLKQFERRFRATNTEEGAVMSTILAYVQSDAAGPRGGILAEFKTSDMIRGLFERALRVREAN